MPNYGLNGQGGGVGPIPLIEGSSSTDESGTASFPAPMSRWGLQVAAASSDVIVVLQGSIASSSAATKTALITFDMSSDGTDGGTQWVADRPVSQVSAVITAGASSGGASCWVSGSP